jgi:ubiquinone/menaquinone biosynthesis C-methylase UbiE
LNRNRVIENAFTGMAPKYEETVDSELRRIWGWSYQEFVNQLLDLTIIEDDDFVLDIATGTGVIPQRLCKIRSNGNRYVGLDITPTMLQHANSKIRGKSCAKNIRLTCASAEVMPFKKESFNQVTCGLATHHMDTKRLISEIFRVLRPGGKVIIADVGAAPTWKLPLVKFLLKLVILFYFLPKEGLARAWAESISVSNMMTAEEWEEAIHQAGFLDIKVKKLKSNHFWAPAPIALKACKKNGLEH